jgi:predicted acetyltransferase
MPELQLYTHQTFPSDLNWQAVSFVRIVWPEIGGGMLRRMFDTKQDTMHFVLVEDGLLHSYAAVVRFQLQHAGQQYRACGLTSVFTYPTSREKGYGQRVVHAATNFIRRSGADIGLLLTGPELEPFYAKSGWEAIMSAPLIGVSGEAQEVLSAFRMMLFLSEKGQAERSTFEAQPLFVDWEWGL